eukprot:3654858-Rhodomonas_salina.1
MTIDASKRLLESLPGFNALATEADPKLTIEIIFDLFEFEVFSLLVIIATYSGDEPGKRITDAIPR